MKWVTRDYVHADRVASPWLIKRFVDPEAEFVFVPWGSEDQRPADAIPLALPGAELGPHDASGSTFRKVLLKYGLDDPALHVMARIVEAAIAFVLHGIEPQTMETKPAIGLLTISEGTMLLEDDDGAIIARGMLMYDALYAYLTAHALALEGGQPMPAADGKGPTRPTIFLRGLLKAAGKRKRAPSS